MSLLYAREKLPQGYRLKERIDLLRSRRQLKRVMCISLAGVAAGILWGILAGISLSSLAAGRWYMAIVRLLVLAAGIALYIIGHEAVHGALMWLISRTKPRFGFKLMYAYAGSKSYFSKWAHICIALAPLVFWGIFLLVLAFALPPEWFWVVWGVQITNISGAAGDLYVTFRMLPKPSHALVQDTGTVMTVFLP